MKRWILFGTLLLLIQVGLTVVTHISNQTDKIKPGQGPLLTLAASEVNEVNELVIEDGEGRRLIIKKDQGRWVLPEVDSFPADAARVQGLIDRLVEQQRGWPEATTAEAAERFQVAVDRFERRLSLRKDATPLGILYLGASSGLRKRYVRVDGDNEIQSLSIGQEALPVQTESWIDTGFLRIDPQKVGAISLPGLRLVRGSDGLQPADISNTEEVVTEQRDRLVRQLTELTISGLLGTTEKSEYGLDTPVLRYAVQLSDGVVIDYTFGQENKSAQAGAQEEAILDGEQTLVLKVSNQAQFFQIESWQVEEIKKATRALLVRTQNQPSAKADEP